MTSFLQIFPRCWLLAMLPLLAALFVPPAGGQVSNSQFFGDDKKLDLQLGTRVTIHWRGVPFHEAVERMEEIQSVAMWLDRRVDRAARVSADLQQEPLGKVLEFVAQQQNIGFVASRGVVYLGPSQAAGELRTLWAIGYQHAASMPAAVRSKLLRRMPLEVPRLAEPREITAAIGRRIDLPIENLSLIPYDLWPERRLPVMPALEQLTLLLSEFDLTWAPSRGDRGVSILPLKRPVLVDRLYSLRDAAQLKSPEFNDLGADARSQPAGDGKRLLVSALVEQHRLLTGQRRSERTAPARRSGNEIQVYSLRINEQPAGAILRQLAAQLKLELVIADELDASQPPLATRVTFEVQQADLQELLDAIGQSAGLTILAREGRIEVSAAIDHP